jgi:hypothetical protein
MDLKIVVNHEIFGFGFWIRRHSSLRFSSLMLFYMIVKFGVATYLENHGKK